jgi:hypothetical protein
MNNNKIICEMNKISRLTLSLLTVAAAMSVSSCDSLTHDDLSECPEGMVIELAPKYAARTSFEAEVNDVRIFIYDSNDNCVKTLDVDGSTLASNDYQVQLSVPEGSYRLVVWNGLSDTKNYSEENAAVTLKTESDNSTENVFKPLWHGALNDVKVAKLSLSHVVVPMVKDTNDFKIFLCKTNGEALNPDDFAFTITSDNGAMAQDNSLLSSPNILYKNFSCTAEDIEGNIDEDIASTDPLGYLHMVRGEINTLRLTTDHPSYLTIIDKANGRNVLRMNLNDYILKAFRGSSANAKMTDQEYFDSEDLFNLTFFLTPRADNLNMYLCTTVIVNDWILRYQEFDLQ